MNKKEQKKQEYAKLLQENLDKLRKQNNRYLQDLKMFRLDGDYKDNQDLKLVEYAQGLIRDEIITEEIKLKKLEQTSNDLAKTITYKIVGTESINTVELNDILEPDHEKGVITSRSPLGFVLSSKKIGQIGEVKTDKEKYQIQIMDIKENN